MPSRPDSRTLYNCEELGKRGCPDACVLGFGGHTIHMPAETLRLAVSKGDANLLNAARIDDKAALCTEIQAVMRAAGHGLRPGELLAAARSAACSSLALSKKQQVSSTTACFRVLGLAPGADEAHVRGAFFGLCRRTHPDRAGGSLQAFQAVNHAYTTILENRDPFSVSRRAVESGQRLLGMSIPFVGECFDVAHEMTYARLFRDFALLLGGEQQALEYGCNGKQTHPHGEKWILELARRLTDARVGQDRSSVAVDYRRLAQLQEHPFVSGGCVSIFFQADPSAAVRQTRMHSPAWLALVDELGLTKETVLLDRYALAFDQLSYAEQNADWRGGGEGSRGNAAKVRAAMKNVGVYLPRDPHGQVMTLDSASLHEVAPSCAGSSCSSSDAGPSSAHGPARKRTRSAPAPDAPSRKRTRSGV